MLEGRILPSSIQGGQAPVKERSRSMKRYEQLTKKQLIEFIKTIRPKADAYDGVLRTLGIDKDIIGYVRMFTKGKEKS
jgi:hypothetical protein